MSRIIVYLILAILVIGGGYIGVVISGNAARASMAEKDGEKFVEKLYAEYYIVGKSCQGQDHDNDGYVSCDFRLLNATNIERIIHLQCPTFWRSFFGESCKESRLIIP